MPDRDLVKMSKSHLSKCWLLVTSYRGFAACLQPLASRLLPRAPCNSDAEVFQNIKITPVKMGLAPYAHHTPATSPIHPGRRFFASATVTNTRCSIDFQKTSNLPFPIASRAIRFWFRTVIRPR
jgi:hypothetical protein